MIQLTGDEARVLGVLVEKAHTTPQQYPMSLNGIVVACNQKSNRWPVTSLSEDDVTDALDGLRKHGLVRTVDLSGSRVIKYRHIAREAISVSTSELVLLAELLMRGPQTAGELRARATRMHELESIEQVKRLLDELAARDEPFVREIPPAPGSRALRYEQLLSPGLHPLDAAAPADHAGAATDVASPAQAAVGPMGAMTERLARLEAAVATLRADVDRLMTTTTK